MFYFFISLILTPFLFSHSMPLFSSYFLSFIYSISFYFFILDSLSLFDIFSVSLFLSFFPFIFLCFSFALSLFILLPSLYPSFLNFPWSSLAFFHYITLCISLSAVDVIKFLWWKSRLPLN